MGIFEAIMKIIKPKTEKKRIPDNYEETLEKLKPYGEDVVEETRRAITKKVEGEGDKS